VRRGQPFPAEQGVATRQLPAYRAEFRAAAGPSSVRTSAATLAALGC
jgi:hypothetical protein